jgi:hypothetical protein
MRRTKAGSILAVGAGAALLLVSSLASATDNKGDTGGKGGLGPQTSAPDTTSNVDETAVLPITRSVDRANNNRQEQEKPWEVGAVFETHRAFLQDDLASGNLVYNVYSAYIRYRITDNDSIGIRESVQEDFIADPGEPGARADDVAITYTRSVPLPRHFLFSVTGSLSAPTSLSSQKAGLITAPRLALSLDKRFGRYIDVSAHVVGGVFIDRYAEAEGGESPNLLGTLTLGVGAEVVMPFHEPLSFGISATTSYIWSYDVQGATSNGTTQDAQYPNQPVQQTYGGEIYARYVLPTLAGLKSDIQIAIADGDPGIGGTNYLHDGVGYTYLYNPQNAGMYAALAVRY